MARREQRERIVLPVKVHGSNARGEPFSEIACVTDISQNGARLEGVQCIIRINEIITLEHSGQQVQFRVAWVGDRGTRMAGCAGLQSLHPLKIAFGMELPPPGPDSFDPATLQTTRDSGTIDRRVVERRQQEERRRHPRYKCTGSLEIRVAGTQLTTWAKISDICMGGCYAELTSPFPVDTEIGLIINVAEERVRTSAMVRSRHPGFGMGIQFLETAPEQIDVLKRVIDVLSGKTEPKPKVVPLAPPAARTAGAPAGAALEAIVKWFGTHDTLTRADFLRVIERDVKKHTG